MALNPYRSKCTFLGRLPIGADLYESIRKFCQDEDIKVGKVTAIGAVKNATVAYYDQRRKKYHTIKRKKEMEILSCVGNVSLKDGKPFVHVHIVLGDDKGKAFGGHLMPGTTVFACELFIEELEGKALDRKLDEKTGLAVWAKDSVLV
ncbi:MAG: PPC domain-containing DNA-binding protein [Bacteroidota bacterium]